MRAASRHQFGRKRARSGGTRGWPALIKRTGSTVAAKLLVYSLLPLFIREILQRNRVTILVYHAPAESTMLEHLGFLSTRYTIISLRRFIEAQRRGEFDKLPRKALVLTFDDGHRSNYCLTDLLRRLGIPATIFVCTALIGTSVRFWFRHAGASDSSVLARIPDEERIRRLESDGFVADAESGEREALSRAEIETMARATVDFQSHTISHPILPNCAAAKAKREIFESKRQLEEEYGFEVFALAYPNGDYSDRDSAFARAAGYECALTVDLGFNDRHTDLFRLKRIAIGDGDGKAVLAVKVCGLWGLLKALTRRQPYGYVSSESRN